LETYLVGHQGYMRNLEIVLIQEFNIRNNVAHRLVRGYGGRAWDVLKIAQEIRSVDDPDDLNDNLIVSGFPYLEAEVIFAVRHDWAVRPEDILARRTRLAFLNKDAAVKAVPKVVQLMAKELHWDPHRQQEETKRCVEYLRHFGGPHPLTQENVIRSATMTDLKSAFRRIDEELGPIGKEDIVLLGEMLNHPLSEEEIRDMFAFGQQHGYVQNDNNDNHRISFHGVASWWNSERCNPGLVSMKDAKMANVKEVEGSGTMFG
jgi:glycerol-3-phosphate dehydrogenase